MSRGLAAALVLTAILSAIFSGCSRGPGQRAPKGDAVIVSEWVPIVKELQARGTGASGPGELPHFGSPQCMQRRANRFVILKKYCRRQRGHRQSHSRTAPTPSDFER